MVLRNYCLLFVIAFWRIETTFSQILEPNPPECQNANVSDADVGKAIFKEERSGTWQRPRLNGQEAVLVNLSLSLSSINDVVEKHHYIKLTGHLALRWFDDIHVWNATFPLYCIRYIVVDSKDLWLPDIAQMNSQEKYSLLSMPGERIRLHSNGFTSFSPGGTFDAFCDFDFTLFPFDTQKCSILMESWRYTHGFVSLGLYRPGKKIGTSNFVENDQWQLIDSEQRVVNEVYTYKELQFDRVEFTIYIKRKAAYYILNVVVPSLIISLAQIATFSLNVADTSKLGLSFTCLLAYSVFQLQIVGDMPRSSDRAPYISLYLDLQMLYIALSMIGQGLAFIFLSKGDEQVPKGLILIVRFLGKVLFMNATVLNDEPERKPDAETAIPDRQTTHQPCNDTKSNRLLLKRRKTDETNDNSQKWLLMASIADRAIFSFYIICISVTPLVFLIRAALYTPALVIL